MSVEQKAFYERQYRGEHYAQGIQDRAEISSLRSFVESYGLKDKHILEVGCGRGAFQDIVDDWHGVDLTDAVAPYIRKGFTAASAESLPFQEGSFDGLWSIEVLEHVPDPEKALKEISRVLMPSGVAYLAPAWHCRPWAAQAYHIRPWSDLDWKGRLIKSTIPLREALWFRAGFALPLRLWRELLFWLRFKRPTRLHYGKLKANYEIYWTSDSDACCSLDPHEMLLWFRSRGWETPSHPTWLSRFLVRHGAIVVRKPERLSKRGFRLAVVTSHPIQYQAPLFRAIASQPEIDLTVYFYSLWGAREYFDPGFGRKVRWDIPLLEGYPWARSWNFSPCPAPGRFWGAVNPGILWDLWKGKFDAVLVHGWARASDWIALLSAFALKLPVFLRGESNLLPKLPRWKALAKRVVLIGLFKRISAFLAIGRANAEFYRAYGAPESKIFVLPYAVDNAAFFSQADKWVPRKSEIKRELGIAPDCPAILYSGKLIEAKRPMDLLLAFEKISGSMDAALVFMGDGILRPVLEEYTRIKGIPNVHFVGFRNQSEFPRFMASADIFALPSGSEPWGLVANEAMCFGLPVVVSDQVGASEDLVRPGINGFAYAASDIEGLAGNLGVLVKDPELRKKMGAASRRIIEKWSYQEDVEGLMKCIREFR